mgnify:CR=1 FL=1
MESEGRINFLMRGRIAGLTITPNSMVAPASAQGDVMELTRAQETELPQALKWQVARADEDYDAAQVEARRITVDTTRIASESFPMAIPPEEAERRCRRALMEAWIGRESATFRLPPSRISLDPADVRARLLDVFARHRNIMPHLHLSLQSGSDRVLRRMCRPYTAGDFVARVELANSILDRPAITTDIIVGFPGETDDDFRRTLDLAQRVGFAKMHVFAFSPRKGAVAARMPEKVPSEVKKERSQVLRDLDHKLQSHFRRRFLGQTDQVLIENTSGRPSGRAERYFTVHLSFDGSAGTEQVHTNDLITVRLVEDTATAVLGVPA